ncbi:hypothetical protein Tco_0808128, partial [Tanacetum coccineum]
MTTLAEDIIVAGAENHPPMLKKSTYDSWASRIRLFIKGKKHGRMMLDSIDNGPLVYLTVEENGQTRPMKYSELTEAQQLQDDCDVQATNIILHGLPPDVYELVNHQEVAMDIWDRLINDMHTIGMKMQQVQVNTKFLNALPSEWSKFVTDVKLAKNYYSEDQYAVSIKEDTTYPCLNSPKATRERRSIRHIQKKSIHRIEDIVKAHDKGKGIMVEEPVKIKKKDQISIDEELAFKLQAEEEEEEERLAREKAQREEEANI